LEFADRILSFVGRFSGFILKYLFLLIFTFDLELFGFRLVCAVIDYMKFRENLLLRVINFIFMFSISIIVIIKNTDFQSLFEFKKEKEASYLFS
jgi:hypothetical protein